ncbi:MAG: hypothetical protein GX754_02900 [Clostridiaceae bacterium]|nr:hypothetical protein [Clostridiaceae bacterium]
MLNNLIHKFAYNYIDKMFDRTKYKTVNKIIENTIRKIAGFFKQLDIFNKVIFFYRYFSLLITSIFFAASSQQRPKLLVIAVISGVGISAIILNSLYLCLHLLSVKQKKFTRLLVLIETVGNALILIPSGGLNSPYLWYSLNTVLVTLTFLDLKYCIFNLMIYLIITTKISHVLFNNEQISFWSVLSRNSNLILSFILITVASHLLITLLNKLKEERNKLIKANEELNLANMNLHRAIEYTMSMNRAIHNLVNQRDASMLARLLIEYTLDITKSRKAFFISFLSDLPDYENHEKYKDYESTYNRSIDDGDDVEPSGEGNGKEGAVFLTQACRNSILKQKDKVLNLRVPVNMKINGENLILSEVGSLYQSYGILGIVVKNDVSDVSNILYKELYNQMRLLSELGSIVFERYLLEESNNRLLINDEQNRIANEIHDTVFQRLFSISCAIHKLMQRQDIMQRQNDGIIEIMPDMDIKSELATMKDSVGNAMKELREIVYKLSWRKKGENVFQSDMLRYIDEISKLTGVKISFSLSGDQELLSYDVKRGICRIIRESTGNAIRHGECRNISISINIDDYFTRLEIKDDGKGFEVNKNIHGTGLGLRNMCSLVNSLNGEVNITSQHVKDEKSEKSERGGNDGQGTLIAVILPNNGFKGIFKEVKKGEAV